MYFASDFSAPALEPADIATAQDAGARFARQMADAEAEDFRQTLAEQLQTIRADVAEVGFSRTDVELAASYFRTGAELEWKRITSRSGRDRFGNA